MNIIKIRLLLMKYRKEISEGEYTHIKDLIALMTIINLSKSFPFDKYYNFKSISLSSLLGDTIGIKNKYRVSTLNTINEQIAAHNKSLNGKGKFFKDEKIDAGLNWLKLLIEFNIINEGDTIDLNDYVLADFIKDEKLAKMFKENGVEYISFDDKLVKILKKS